MVPRGGDGFESVSTVAEGQICGEVFRDRIVDAWPIPMTISFIVASLTDEMEPPAANEKMRLARTIIERPWVELASHSVLHPLDWRRSRGRRSLPRSVVWYESLRGFEAGLILTHGKAAGWRGGLIQGASHRVAVRGPSTRPRSSGRAGGVFDLDSMAIRRATYSRPGARRTRRLWHRPAAQDCISLMPEDSACTLCFRFSAPLCVGPPSRSIAQRLFPTIGSSPRHCSVVSCPDS